MRRTLRRIISVYGAFAAMEPKFFLAYNLWFWAQFIIQIASMTIFVYFWRAVYASSTTIGGLNLGQTLNYILLAQVFVGLVQNRQIFFFGSIIRNGQLAIELVRPVDFQGRQYAKELADVGIDLITKLPLVVLAIVAFGLQLPSNPLVYIVFLLSLVLGQAVLFFFDWIFACLAFYSTETWGLSVVREGLALFFSGALVPLAIMPGWLQTVANALPFAQALYVPVSILSGITPLANAPQLLLLQLAWLIGLGLLSRLVFNVAVRVITVQGG